MKKDIDNLKPEETWAQAEEMLDAHFKKRRVIVRVITYTGIALLLLLSSVLLMDSDNKSKSGKIKPAVNSSPLNNIVANSSDKEKISPLPVNINIQTSKEKHSSSKETQNTLKEKQDTKKRYSSRADQHVNKTTREIVFKNNKTPRNVDALDKQGSDNSGVAHANNATLAEAEKLVFSSSKINETNNTDLQDKTLSGNEQSRSSNIALLESFRLSHISIDDFSPSLISNSYSMSDEVKPIPDKKYNLHLLVYGSLQYAFKNLESGQYSEYAERRKEEEDGILTNSLGAALSYTRNKYAVSLGLEYSTWGENADYSPYLYQDNYIDNSFWQSFVRTVVDTDTAYIYGNQYFLRTSSQALDSSYVVDYDTVNQLSYDSSGVVLAANGTNKFHYVELPIEFSYRFSESKLGFGISVGFSPGLLTRSSGNYLTRDLTGVEKISEIREVNKFMFNGRMSLDVYYAINSNFQLTLRPQIKANLNSVFSDQFGVKQKYYSTGMLIGVSYRIK